MWREGLHKTDVGHSFQVDFGSLRKVTRVATQGSAESNFPFYVKSFKFKYSNDSIVWREYSEYGRTKVNRGFFFRSNLLSSFGHNRANMPQNKMLYGKNLN